MMNKGNCIPVCHGKRAPVLNWFLKRKLRKLKLGELQRKQLDQLISSAASVRRDRLSAKGELHSNVAELLSAPEFNREKAAEVIRTATAHHIDSATKFIDIFGEFYDGLESWQQEQLQAMWQKRGRCGVRCCH
jgi:Spy/CpxP family protein refolding chaperone